MITRFSKGNDICWQDGLLQRSTAVGLIAAAMVIFAWIGTQCVNDSEVKSPMKCSKG